MTYTSEEIKIANKTSRNSLAVGERAIVPRYVQLYIKKEQSILDFGAGKAAAHALRFKEKGYNITAYDFGGNCIEGLHDPNALSKKYDLVYASNVLNVQSTERMLDLTILQIKRVMNDPAIFIANYPLTPRKLNLNGKEMLKYLQLHFTSVEVINQDNSRPVFLIKK